MRQSVVAVAVAVAFALAAPSVASAATDEITPGDLETAAEVRRVTAAELADATARYEENIDRARDLDQKLTSIEIQLAVKERELITTRAAASGIARELYMASGSGGVALVLDSSSVTEIPLRQEYMGLVSANGAATLNHLEALEVTYVEQQARLAAASADQAAVTAEAESLAALILRRLEEAESGYRGLISAYQAQEAEKARLAELERLRREEEERLRREEEAAAAAAATTTTTTTRPPATTTTTRPPPPVVVDGRVCPIDGPTSFVDTWGAARSGGRRHEGVDMISPRNTPLVAIESGKVKKLGNGGLGGVTVWIRGDDGDEYYYAHMEGWADGLRAGKRVEVGELIGYVGNSGNARYTITHLHFEYHPGGGSAVNPYPLVAELCL